LQDSVSSVVVLAVNALESGSTVAPDDRAGLFFVAMVFLGGGGGLDAPGYR
jgi:hypothetical protein